MSHLRKMACNNQTEVGLDSNTIRIGSRIVRDVARLRYWFPNSKWRKLKKTERLVSYVVQEAPRNADSGRNCRSPDPLFIHPFEPRPICFVGHHKLKSAHGRPSSVGCWSIPHANCRQLKLVPERLESHDKDINSLECLDKTRISRNLTKCIG